MSDEEEKEMLEYELAYEAAYLAACEVQSPNSLDFELVVNFYLKKLGYEN